MTSRDDFTPRVKDLIAKRVGFRCSNPKCGRTTSGPSSDPTKAVNLGVAAHITAASPGGPRFDASLSESQRKSAENGIWVCQFCSRLIDVDSPKYTVTILRNWKRDAEREAEDETSGILAGILPHLSKVNIASLFSANDELANTLSSELEQRLDQLQLARREGASMDSATSLWQLRNQPLVWSVLSPEIQSRLLCFEGTLALPNNDLELAKSLAAQAQTVFSSEVELRLRALIAFYDHKPDIAVTLLSDAQALDSLNLRASILLDSGNQTEAFDLLDEIKKNFGIHAETLRIEALGYLSKKEIDQAKLAIQKALELEPRWDIIQYAAGLINYYGALAYIALPAQPLAWPEPVDWTVINKDDQSQGQLEQAATIFASLRGKKARESDDYVRLGVWHLACLANHVDHQADARQVCQELLAERPSEYIVIAWGAARAYDLDLESSITALEQLVTENTNIPTHVYALFHCYISTGRTSEAVQLLKRTKGRFQDDISQAQWYLLAVQRTVSGGKFEEAEELTEEIRNGEDQLRAKTIIALARLQVATEENREQGHQQTENLARQWLQKYEQTLDARYLLDYCDVMARLESWGVIAEFASTLISAVPTSSVLSLVAVATYNAQHFTTCLNLLDENLHLFPARRLPHFLRRLRRDCLFKLGILPQALADGEQLFVEVPSTSNLLHLLQIHFHFGNITEIAYQARLLRERNDVPPASLLWVAQLISEQDRTLAIELWRKATGNLPDDLVGSAVNTGYQLGLDDTLAMRVLMQKLRELGESGQAGILTGKLEDFVDFFNKQRIKDLELADLYVSAKTPLHLIAAVKHIPLSDFYHAKLLRIKTNEALASQPILFARHGNRPFNTTLPDLKTNWRLHIDITALLLANHLDLLDVVENAFSSLRIPHNVIPTLLQMRTHYKHHQPTQVQAIREVLQLVDRNRIRAFEVSMPTSDEGVKLASEIGQERASLIDYAVCNGRLLVEFLPLHKLNNFTDFVELSEQFQSSLINIRAIVEGLLGSGFLTANEYVAVLDKLGTEGLEAPTKPVPTKGVQLCMSITVAKMLAGANILSQVCQCYSIFLPQQDISQARRDLDQVVQDEDNLRWLDNLIARIQVGLQNGNYQLLPELTQSPDEASTANDLLIHDLLSLMSFPSSPGDVIWIDERYATAFLHRNGVPIVTIVEVLDMLVTKGLMDKTTLYTNLHKLRAANVRYLPIRSDEIFYHLRAAPVINNQLVETAELKTLRQYTAACLLDGKFLQQPTDNSTGEIPFLVALNRQIGQTLGLIWSHSNDNPLRRYLESEWIISALYLDIANIRRLVLMDAHQNDQFLLAFSLADLLQTAFILEQDDQVAEDDTNVQAEYFDWLFQRILTRHFASNSTLLISVVEIFKSNLRFVLDDLTKRVGQEVAIFGIQRFYHTLPDPIRAELRKDAELMKELHLTYVAVVTLDGVSFTTKEFIYGASESVNGRTTTVPTLNGQRQIAFIPHEVGPNQHGFSFDNPITNTQSIIFNEDFGLLSESPKGREQLLHQNHYWLDCNMEVQEQLIAEIASIGDPLERMTRLHDHRDHSASHFYQLLSQRTFTKYPSPDELFPLHFDSLVKYLRLPTQATPSEFASLVESAAHDLIRTDGIIEAFFRLATLPVALPNQMIAKIKEMTLEEKQAFVGDILKQPGSPISDFHVLRILLELAEESSAFLEQSKQYVVKLVSQDAKNDFDTFQRILQWVYYESFWWAESQALSPVVQLSVVWMHTSNLVSIFALRGIPSGQMVEFITKFASQRPTVQLFQLESEEWFDVCHPHRITWSVFALSSLAYALNNNYLIVDESIRADLQSQDSFDGIELLRSLPLARNLLGTFFGENLDVVLAAIADQQNIAATPLHSVEEVRNKALERAQQLSRDNDPQCWFHLHILIGDLCPPDELKAYFSALILSTDFRNLFEIQDQHASIALTVATLQLRHIHTDALEHYLVDQLVSIAKYYARRLNEEGSFAINRDGEIQRYLELVNLAFNIVVAKSDKTTTFSRFADLLEQLMMILPQMFEACRQFIQILYENLSVEEARKFARLLVICRANS